MSDTPETDGTNSTAQALKELAAVMHKWNLYMEVRTTERSYSMVVDGIDITQAYKEGHWHYTNVEMGAVVDADDLTNKAANTTPNADE